MTVQKPQEKNALISELLFIMYSMSHLRTVTRSLCVSRMGRFICSSLTFFKCTELAECLMYRLQQL